ncbi:regulatory protein RecX [Trueperella pyogenes]|uniref:regulatory protein RecX n=1 Tax=Trueperella pyogenes TaxID=1661 RepID=UPI000D258E68|nr:regulatory protein RecX [Trueperella pyogenes]AWA42843.1 recombination regulator RecX [Trueperella pyogenes]
MVNYAEDADVRPRRRSDPARRLARAAARSEDEWRSYARDLCYRQLAAMERSTQQLRDAMERNLVPDYIAQETLDAFCAANLVNDERFARMYVRSKFTGKTTTRRVLAQELERKGVGKEEIANALAQISDEDEAAAAIEFARRKAKSMSQLDTQTQRRRIYGALGRRGFRTEHIRQAIAALIEDPQDSPWDTP